MKAHSLPAIFSSICLWTAFMTISSLSAADDPLEWVRPEVPAPDAEGWITLFDGRLLHACDPESIRNRTDRIGVGNGELWLDNTTVHFNVSARNVALRAIVKKVSGQNLMLKCRQSQGRSYGFWFNGGGDFGIGMYKPQWTGITGAKAARNFPDFFQMELSSEDSLITLKANDETLKAFEDHAINDSGAVGISTYLGKSHFKKIQVKILDAPPPPLSWTSSAGKTIQAEFVSLEGESVVIRKDGKEISIPLIKLSLESRNQARKMAGSPPAAASPVTATPVAGPPPTGIPDHPGIPKPGAWRNANSTGLPKPGIDRVFLINRGWLEGRLLGVDRSSITMQSGGDTLRLPRNQVSVVGLSDSYNPEKRTNGQEIRLRVVMEGPAECATLHFTRGALIRNVLKQPQWMAGGDPDDKAFTDRTTFSFDKGRDQSITRLEAEFEVLLPSQGDLNCEVNNNRSNGHSGPLTLRFIEPDSGREIAALTPPKNGKHGMWYAFEIAREKLLKPARPHELDPLPVKFDASRIPSLGLVSNQAIRPRLGTARLIFATEPARVAHLDAIDAKDIVLADPQHTRIPRERIVWVELLDWQLDPVASPKDAPKETPPLRWVSYGVSTTNSITLPPGASFAKMIVPPYCLAGMDRGDSFVVKDERSIQCHKGDMDQSPFHSEMVATLTLPPEPAVNLQIANAYTNVWSGHWEFVILHAISNRRIVDFKSGNWQLNASSKIQSSKLMAP